jgi:hypothetical protein
MLSNFTLSPSLDSHHVGGAPGNWRLAVDPGACEGQFKVTLSCL